MYDCSLKNMKESSIVLIVLTFVVLIAIVLLADSVTSAMLLILLVVNLYVGLCQCGALETLTDPSEVNLTKENMEPDVLDKSKNSDLTADSTIASEQIPQPSMYGVDYDIWQANNASSDIYPTPQLPVFASCGEKSGVDAQLSLLALKRARDKRCADGAAVKNADYYKFHFSDELEQTENKPWWSAAEY